MTRAPSPPNHIAAFAQAPFSCSDLTDIPSSVSEEDVKLFQESLLGDHRSAALLWEDHFLPKYRVPFFLVRVADIHSLLWSPSSALPLYEEASQAIKARDETFENYLCTFREKVIDWPTEQSRLLKPKEYSHSWLSARARRFPTNIYAPPSAAKELKSVNSDLPLLEKFHHFLMLEINQVEGVFALTRSSAQDIINNGIQTGRVECSPASGCPQYSTEFIRDTLMDTQAAFDMLNPVVQNSDLLTPAFIKSLHTRLFKHSRINLLKGIYTNPGVTRTTTKKFAFIKRGMTFMECCPAEEVDGELEYICGQARQWIRTWGDMRSPFAVAAWLDLLITQCHPFDNGNGQLSRFLASIPLLRMGYPPICISMHFAAGRYNPAMQRAYDGVYDDLAACFVESTANALEEMKSGWQ